MNSNLTITKERVLKAAKKCESARVVLQELFPEVFEDEWESRGGGLSWWCFDPDKLDRDRVYKVVPDEPDSHFSVLTKKKTRTPAGI